MTEQFEQFIKERQFISNVSPAHNPCLQLDCGAVSWA